MIYIKHFKHQLMKSNTVTKYLNNFKNKTIRGLMDCLLSMLWTKVYIYLCSNNKLST